MLLDVGSIIIVCLIVNYLMLIPVFRFMIEERIRNIDNIVASRNPRKRVDLAKTRHALRRKKASAFLWPLLFLRGSLDASKKKK
jgi:hypothetical protein